MAMERTTPFSVLVSIFVCQYWARVAKPRELCLPLDKTVCITTDLGWKQHYRFCGFVQWFSTTRECGHGWTSMKGRVAFWFHLNYMCNEGFLTFKLYGQQCQRCKSGSFENSMWYPEEVCKVMSNVFNRVGKMCYGLHQVPYRKCRRPGKPRTPHNMELCQACQDGVCTERR